MSAWLADLDSDGLSAQAKAGVAVQAIGTNALPVLARMLRVRDPLWKQALMGLNARQSLFQLPVIAATIVQHRALRGYLELGKAAAPAVPELIRILQEAPTAQARAYAATALGRIGPEAKAAVPVLRQATQAQDQELRESAIWALANIERTMDAPRSRVFER